MQEGEPIEGGEPISNEPGAEMDPTSAPETEASAEIERGVAEIHSRLEQIEEASIRYSKPVGFAVQGGEGVDPGLRKSVPEENLVLYGGLDTEVPQEAIDRVKEELEIGEKPLRTDTDFKYGGRRCDMELYPTKEPRLVFNLIKDHESKEVRAQRFIRVMQRPS